jgi:hypothetical protein
MSSEQTIEFLDRGTVNLASGFPPENFLAKILSQPMNHLEQLSGADRILPLAEKGCELLIVDEFGGPTPAQECLEIRQEFCSLPILDRTCVQ